MPNRAGGACLIHARPWVPSQHLKNRLCHLGTEILTPGYILDFLDFVLILILPIAGGVLLIGLNLTPHAVPGTLWLCLGFIPPLWYCKESYWKPTKEICETDQSWVYTMRVW